MGRELKYLARGNTTYGVIGASHVASVVKNPPANARDARGPVSIPGLGRSPKEGNGNQNSCWEKSHGQRN